MPRQEYLQKVEQLKRPLIRERRMERAMRHQRQDAARRWRRQGNDESAK